MCKLGGVALTCMCLVADFGVAPRECFTLFDKNKYPVSHHVALDRQTVLRAPAGPQAAWETDSVFTTLMISTHMLSKLTDSVDEEGSLTCFNHLELTTRPCSKIGHFSIRTNYYHHLVATVNIHQDAKKNKKKCNTELFGGYIHVHEYTFIS